MAIQLPVMNGVEATKAIRNSTTLGTKKTIRIIAVNAHAQSGDRETFLAAGMDAYLSTPIGLKELQELLGSV